MIRALYIDTRSGRFVLHYFGSLITFSHWMQEARGNFRLKSAQVVEGLE